MRNVEGGYRYGYQGEFAEKDQETGLNAFEARLWDARIGRWLTVDPAGQYFSPYMGMDNNPISTVDPDGRCTDCAQCPEQCDGNGNFLLDEVVITAPQSGSWGADAITYGSFENSYAGSTASYQQNWPEFTGMNYKQMVAHYEENYGEYNRDLEAQLLLEEEIRRKEALALHLMNFGKFLAMEAEMVALETTVPKFKLRGRQGPLRPMNAKNPKSFEGVSAKQVKQHLEKHGWEPAPTNPNKMYQGTRYTNGVKGEQIRIMPGGAKRSIPIKQGPHMIISRNGVKIIVPLQGNPTL